MARRPSLALAMAAGDMAVFLVFALLGSASHEGTTAGKAVARTVIPFGVSWLVIGAALGSLRRQNLVDPARVWSRVLGIWLVCGTVGVFLRSWWFDRPLDGDFAAVAVLLQGAFLLAWRLAAARLRRAALRRVRHLMSVGGPPEAGDSAEAD